MPFTIHTFSCHYICRGWTREVLANIKQFPIDIIARFQILTRSDGPGIGCYAIFVDHHACTEIGLKLGPILAMVYTYTFIFLNVITTSYGRYTERFLRGRMISLCSKESFLYLWRRWVFRPYLIFAGAIFLVIVLFILLKIFAFLSIQVDKISPAPFYCPPSLILFLIPFALKKSSESHPDSVDHNQKGDVLDIWNIHTTFIYPELRVYLTWTLQYSMMFIPTLN